MQEFGVSFFFLIIMCSVIFGCTSDSKLKQRNSHDPHIIMQKAHEVSGGNFWQNPKSLRLMGRAIFYKNKDTLYHEKHNMYRIYESHKSEAHKANGKVRIESYRENKAIILLTYDGKNTYDLNGKQAESEADKRWSSNFGFGVIRHAFDKGYQLSYVGENEVKSQKTFQVNIIDPEGGETIFDISQDDYKIVRVGFDTPRGWHERIYSNFFTKKKYNWLQSGLVELYYDNVKSNDVIWEDFEVNESLPDRLFILE